MPAKPDNLTMILNKLWAMRQCGIVTLRDIADGVDANERSAADWITQRRRIPNGESALKLQNFTTNQTIRIALLDKSIQAGYRSAYKTACALFPTTGGKGK